MTARQSTRCLRIGLKQWKNHLKFLRGSFSAVSTATMARKDAFCSIFWDLQELLSFSPLRFSFFFARCRLRGAPEKTKIAWPEFSSVQGISVQFSGLACGYPSSFTFCTQASEEFSFCLVTIFRYTSFLVIYSVFSSVQDYIWLFGYHRTPISTHKYSSESAWRDIGKPNLLKCAVPVVTFTGTWRRWRAGFRYSKQFLKIPHSILTEKNKKPSQKIKPSPRKIDRIFLSFPIFPDSLQTVVKRKKTFLTSGKLSGTPSRLYRCRFLTHNQSIINRSRFLQVNTRCKTLAEIY